MAEALAQAESHTMDDRAVSPDVWHRLGITTDGVYQGLIGILSAPGLLVDAANNAPRILNILPGDQGFGPITDDPFLGSSQIRRGLTGLYNGYNDLTGVEVPETVDMTDHLLHLGGRVAGSAAASGGGAAVIGNSSMLSGAMRGAAGSLTNIQDSRLIATAGGMAARIIRPVWWAMKNPVTAFNAATGLAITGTAADLTLNDGRISGAVAGAAVDTAVERVTGFEGIGDAWERVAPEPLKDGLDDVMDFLAENPALAKWGSFGLALMAGNSLLSHLVPAIPGRGLLSLALAGAIAWGLSEALERTVLSRETAPPAPAAPVPAM